MLEVIDLSVESISALTLLNLNLPPKLLISFEFPYVVKVFKTLDLTT